MMLNLFSILLPCSSCSITVKPLLLAGEAEAWREWVADEEEAEQESGKAGLRLIGPQIVQQSRGLLACWLADHVRRVAAGPVGIDARSFVKRHISVILSRLSKLSLTTTAPTLTLEPLFTAHGRRAAPCTRPIQFIKPSDVGLIKSFLC